MLKLETLKIKGVRGIVDGPILHIKNDGLLLCGENGTGKSSYIDAIEKVLTGKCSPLDDSGQRVSWRKQGGHISGIESEIELTLADEDKSVLVTLNTDNSALDSQAVKFLDAARRQSFILRRRTLLDFINAVPRDRYQAIEHFLKLDKYGAFEGQLKELLKDVETKLTRAKNDKAEYERTLKEKLGLKKTAVVSETTCIEAVNNTLKACGIALLTTLQDISIRVENVNDQLTPLKSKESLQIVHALEGLIKQIPDIQQLHQTVHEYLAARKEVMAEETRLKGYFYVQILEDGLTWITEDRLEQCPLCNNLISIADVKAYVEASVAKHQQFITLKQQQLKAHAAFQSILQQFRIEDIQKQSQDIFGKELPEQVSKTLQYIGNLLKLHRNVLPVPEIERVILELSENSHFEGFQILQNEIELKLAGFPDDTRYEQLYSAKSQLQAISVHLGQITEANKRIAHLELCQGQLKIVAELAERGRKNAVQTLLDVVVDLADEYFQKIHSGEKIGRPNLVITERGEGSIELMSQFHTEIGDPRGYYSEGHVDSLGLCLFLAIRRIHHTQHPELALLVLDDVMHSVDANHRRDTANLIFEEFSDHQIIITTHDPLWFEYLKTASKNKKFTQHRIADWSLETGPVWGNHLSIHEWLISEEGIIAKPADLVIKAGVLLEEMLQNLCNNLSISVPFRIRGDHTIDPLWKSFFTAVGKKEGFFEVAKQCLEEIEELRSLRNWVGAHWNEWAQDITKDEAIAFTDAVLQLRHYTYCSDCNQFITRIGELEGVWSCKKECKRYNKKPSKGNTSSSSHLLSWEDLTEMGISNRRRIGRFMSMIRDEEKAGKITTREEAVIFVNKHLNLTSTL